MSIEMYVLGLLKFKDGRIEFSEEELGTIGKEIGDYLRRQKLLSKDPEKMEGWHVYTLSPKSLDVEESIKDKIDLAELGYCHHRVVVHFSLRLEKYPEFRKIRKKLKKLSSKIIRDYVKKKMNELVYLRKVSRNGLVKFVYAYPLIIVKEKFKKHREIPFSGKTTSLSFEIVEPSWWHPSGKKYMMTITIPNTILYTQENVDKTSLRDKGLFRDIINAIYQHCLYEKKAEDERKLEEEMKGIDEEKLEGWQKVMEKKAIERKIFDNRLDENLLVRLWTHFLDTMGGTSAEIHAARIKSTQRFLTMVAVIIAALTFAIRYIFLPVLEFFLN